ncbi:MAG: hypothetical protein FWF35_01865 [Elusimicrobia bacterium]|nr:hypothetical protein [Elusimicrobiota bacterium]
MDLNKIEKLLETGRPSKVIAAFKNYKGKNAAALFLWGEAERMSGNFEAALKIYARAAQGNKDACLKIEILLSEAACERTLGRSERAYKTASAAYISAEWEDYKISALQEAGMALRAWGKFDESLKYLNQVLAYYKAGKNYAGISFILWAKGGISRLQGRFEDGIKEFKTAAAYAKKSGDKINLAYAYCGLAGISRIAGNARACVAYYRRADKIFRRSEDIFGKAYTNCGMANGLRQLGRLKEALTCYKKADELYSKIGDKVDLGFVKWGIADALKRQNKINESLNYLASAEKLFAGSDEKRGQILTKISLAQTLYALGRAAEAKEKYDAAVSQAKVENLNTYLEIYT